MVTIVEGIRGGSPKPSKTAHLELLKLRAVFTGLKPLRPTPPSPEVNSLIRESQKFVEAQSDLED